jgi:hypothetical protein
MLQQVSATTKLRAVRTLHTVAWAFFASAVVLIPVAAARGSLRLAWILTAIVAVECLILVANGLRCPLTPLAARYTDDRADNFDIYLPLWLARYNKQIFGTLYLLGILYATYQWLQR